MYAPIFLQWIQHEGIKVTLDFEGIDNMGNCQWLQIRFAKFESTKKRRLVFVSIKMALFRNIRTKHHKSSNCPQNLARYTKMLVSHRPLGGRTQKPFANIYVLNIKMFSNQVLYYKRAVVVRLKLQ